MVQVKGADSERNNLFAKSRIMPQIALRQFNELSPVQRIKIKKSFDEYDKIRRNKIPTGEIDPAWELSVMVDAHIIATENNIDPLTAVMCIYPVCKSSKRVVLK